MNSDKIETKININYVDEDNDDNHNDDNSVFNYKGYRKSYLEINERALYNMASKDTKELDLLLMTGKEKNKEKESDEE